MAPYSQCLYKNKDRVHAACKAVMAEEADRRKLLEWRVATAAGPESAAQAVMKSSAARLRLAKMRALPREEDVLLALLRDHKMPTKPLETNP